MNQIILIPQRTKSPKHPFLTREQLRIVATLANVKRGRNTGDTIANLRRAGVSISVYQNAGWVSA